MRVGLRIKELRNRLGVSQEAFAYSIEMSRTYFAEVETGRRNVSIENIDRIAKGLGVCSGSSSTRISFRAVHSLPASAMNRGTIKPIDGSEP